MDGTERVSIRVSERLTRFSSASLKSASLRCLQNHLLAPETFCMPPRRSTTSQALRQSRVGESIYSLDVHIPLPPRRVDGIFEYLIGGSEVRTEAFSSHIIPPRPKTCRRAEILYGRQIAHCSSVSDVGSFVDVCAEC